MISSSRAGTQTAGTHFDKTHPSSLVRLGRSSCSPGSPGGRESGIPSPAEVPDISPCPGWHIPGAANGAHTIPCPPWEPKPTRAGIREELGSERRGVDTGLRPQPGVFQKNTKVKIPAHKVFPQPSPRGTGLGTAQKNFSPRSFFGKQWSDFPSAWGND